MSVYSEEIEADLRFVLALCIVTRSTFERYTGSWWQMGRLAMRVRRLNLAADSSQRFGSTSLRQMRFQNQAEVNLSILSTVEILSVRGRSFAG